MTNALEEATARLAETGYVFLSPQELRPVLHVDVASLAPLANWWADLPRDQYLRDGGRYRSRRHSCFVQDNGGTLAQVAHRAHWQPTSYNALHGGLERWFEPIAASVVQAAAWRRLLTSIGDLFLRLRQVERWFIEAHQFRIDTTGGIGRPTPEGAHRDGVDFVALMLVQRHNVRGGETRVFDAHGSSGVRFTMQEPWSLLLMDDARVIHETTPIQPDPGSAHPGAGQLPGGPRGAAGVRDTLVLTYRAGGFQAPG